MWNIAKLWLFVFTHWTFSGETNLWETLMFRKLSLKFGVNVEAQSQRKSMMFKVKQMCYSFYMFLIEVVQHYSRNRQQHRSDAA